MVYWLNKKIKIRCAFSLAETYDADIFFIVSQITLISTLPSTMHSLCITSNLSMEISIAVSITI